VSLRQNGVLRLEKSITVRTAVYGTVCAVVWEGGVVRSVPIIMIKIQTARRKLTIEPGKPSVERPAQGLFHPPMALSAPPRERQGDQFFLWFPL
jgi:hypothetical protein